MRVLLVIVLLIVVFVALGYVTMSRDGNSATVTVDTDKVKSDTTEVLKKTNDALDRMVDGAADGLQRDPDLDTTVDAEPVAP